MNLQPKKENTNVTESVAGLTALSQPNSMISKPMDASAVAQLFAQPQPEVSENPKQWFVMRDLTRPNAKLSAYQRLEGENIRCYTPMQERQTVKNGRTVRELVPIVHDLLFAYDSFEHLNPIVQRIPTLQFRFQKGRQREPMVMSDADMASYIAGGLSKTMKLITLITAKS